MHLLSLSLSPRFQLLVVISIIKRERERESSEKSRVVICIAAAAARKFGSLLLYVCIQDSVAACYLSRRATVARLHVLYSLNPFIFCRPPVILSLSLSLVSVRDRAQRF